MAGIPCNTTPRLIPPGPARRAVPQVHSTEKCVDTRLGIAALALTCAPGEAAGAAADV